MRKNLPAVTNLFLCIGCLAFPLAVAAQGISERMCEGVFASVASAMKPTKVYRRKAFSSSCDFEFALSSGSSVLLSIGQYENSVEGEKAFKADGLDAAGDPRPISPFGSKEVKAYWDEIALFPSKREYDSFLLLRKQRLVVQVFCDDNGVFAPIENLIRGAFDGPF